MGNNNNMEEEYRFIFSKKMKIILFILLIILNLVIRIPFYPHEQGSDSFVIHILGNSISEFGHLLRNKLIEKWSSVFWYLEEIIEDKAEN